MKMEINMVRARMTKRVFNIKGVPIEAASLYEAELIYEKSRKIAKKKK